MALAKPFESRVPPAGDRYRAALATSERLAKAIAHPLRVRILSELNERGELSPKRFKDLTDAREPVQTISKHFRRLEELGCVEEVRQRKSGRQRECVFCAVDRPQFDRAAWTSLLTEKAQGLTERGFTSYVELLAQSMEAGSFEAREDRKFHWTSLTFDATAWAQMVEAVEALFWCSVADWGRAEGRLAKTDEEPIPVAMGLSLVEAPPSVNTLDQLQNLPFFLEDEGKLYFDQNLAAGLTHGMRLMILGALRAGPLSPKSFHDTSGALLGVSLARVAQQFDRLAELGCIELVERRKGRRGRPEKVYAAIRRSLYDGSPWEAMPASLEAEAMSLTITTFIEAFAESVAADAADRREDSHFSWVEMRLDEEAWADLTTRIDAFFRFARVLHEQSAERLEAGGAEGQSVLLALAAFESSGESEVSPEATLRKLRKEIRPDTDGLRELHDRVVECFSRNPADEFRRMK